MLFPVLGARDLFLRHGGHGEQGLCNQVLILSPDSVDLGLGQTEVVHRVHRPEHGRRVRGAAAEPTAHRDPLVEPELHGEHAAHRPLEREVRLHREVPGDRPVDVAGTQRVGVPEDRVPREPVGGQSLRSPWYTPPPEMQLASVSWKQIAPPPPPSSQQAPCGSQTTSLHSTFSPWKMPPWLR